MASMLHVLQTLKPKMKKKQVIRSIMNETSEKKSSTKAAPSNNDKQQAINKGRKGIFSLLFKIQKKKTKFVVIHHQLECSKETQNRDFCRHHINEKNDTNRIHYLYSWILDPQTNIHQVEKWIETSFFVAITIPISNI